jgi:hypothetical protein
LTSVKVRIGRLGCDELSGRTFFFQVGYGISALLWGGPSYALSQEIVTPKCWQKGCVQHLSHRGANEYSCCYFCHTVAFYSTWVIVDSHVAEAHDRQFRCKGVLFGCLWVPWPKDLCSQKFMLSVLSSSIVWFVVEAQDLQFCCRGVLFGCLWVPWPKVHALSSLLFHCLVLFWILFFWVSSFYSLAFAVSSFIVCWGSTSCPESSHYCQSCDSNSSACGWCMTLTSIHMPGSWWMISGDVKTVASHCHTCYCVRSSNYDFFRSSFSICWTG